MTKGGTVLISACLVSAVLGSIHAFSVFLAPLEAAFGAVRATISLTYSLGLVCLTAAVLFGPRIYERMAPWLIFAIVGIVGAMGALIASAAGTIAMLWIGYGVIFGAANGLGYGFGLQFAARANPKHAGFAMGAVTAAYALGAALSPLAFEAAIQVRGHSLALQGLAVSILLAGVTAAALIRRSGAAYTEGTTRRTPITLPNRKLAAIWLAYGGGVAAGLMAIGHAAGIAESAGFTGWHAPAILAVFNLAGSLTAGHLMDRAQPKRVIVALAALSAASLAALAAWPAATLLFLSMVGFAYGGTIAAYPAAIARLFPGDMGPRAYGRVFTAWGTAGLLAPWAAGRVYDVSGGYTAALTAASLLALGSAAFAWQCFSADGTPSTE